MRPPHRAVPQTWTLQVLSVVRPATHHVRRPLRHAAHHAASRPLHHAAHHATTKLLLSRTKGDRVPATQAQDLTGRPTVEAGSVDRPTSKSIVRIRLFCNTQRRRHAQRHDTQRRDARRPCHPDDDDTPDVKRKRRLKGLALAVCFIPKSQTCNSYKINPFR